MRAAFHKRMLVLLVVLGALVAATQEKLVYSEPQKLAHGYRLVRVGVDLSECTNCFEGVAHYTDLYDGKRKLSRVGEFSISPSGAYAAWEDSSEKAIKSEGLILLYERKSRTVRDITVRPFALPSDFSWDEAKGTLKIEYYEDNGQKHEPSLISLVEKTADKK